MFDLAEHLVCCRFEISEKAVFDGDRMDDDTSAAVFRTPLGRRAGDESDSVQQGVELIIRAADRSFRKQDQGPFCFFEDVDSRVDGLPIDAFAIPSPSPTSRR